MSSPGYCRPDTATTMYCRPSAMYVIGALLTTVTISRAVSGLRPKFTALTLPTANVEVEKIVTSLNERRRSSKAKAGRKSGPRSAAEAPPKDEPE